MRELIILLTCLALTPVFAGCGGGSEGTDPPKEVMDEMIKKRMEVKEAAQKKMKKK